MSALTIDQAIRSAARLRPEAVALVDAPNRDDFFGGSSRRLTWREVDRAVDNLGASLALLGAGPGAPVAIQLPNVVELPLTILACGRIGATAVPFPIQHRRHELEFGLPTAGVKIMVTATRPDRPDQLEAVGALVKELESDIRVAAFGSSPTGVESLSIDTSESAHRHIGLGPDDVTTVCWTSGTTGTPKGVPRTGVMWLASGQFQVDQLELAADDRILCPFPVVNMAGIGGMLVPWAMAGAALFLHQPLDLGVFLSQLTSEAITYTVAPPPLLNMLLANEAMLEGVDLSNVRKISSGSAPLDPWMVEGWDKRGIEIVNVFGSNEGATMLSTREVVPDPGERARFFPRPDREGVHVRLVDLTSGADISEPGIPGELRFSGPTVFDGYLQSSGEEFDAQGYYRTGDIFEWVPETTDPQLLRFVDRAKDIIIRGGMNISAAEVEGLISGLDSVVECAAVGYPDSTLGERVGVFVVAAPESEPTLQEVIEHLRAQEVASYKLPERIELVEALPRNPVGKVTKPELRERWAE
ncbi:MAG: class I adenylate-forming enzyme family protein [Acidimicrobiales bacterium]|jgi:acyl-CoA synthetase (AMP-forming)/AMP-acid ligase II